MIQTFVSRFEDRRGDLAARFAAEHPANYLDLVREVVRVLSDEDDYNTPDPNRVHQIDDGDYQGTLVFVIAATGYQPDDYWYVKVGYGSCSGCDTLQAISGYSDAPPSEQQIADYMTLALHVVQGIGSMNGDAA